VEGAFIATAHSCWGILNSTGTGLVMSELILDGTSKTISLDVFNPRRLSKK
jgi:glycine/D-amino acid oxidase-like deaminating enzyme